MLSGALEDKLNYFNEQKFEISDNEVLLVEKEKQGKVKLKCKLDKETLVFHSPAENVLSYLDEQKKYATAGPDKFLFQSGTETQTVTGVVETGKIRRIYGRNRKSNTDTIGIEQVLKGRWFTEIRNN